MLHNKLVVAPIGKAVVNVFLSAKGTVLKFWSMNFFWIILITRHQHTQKQKKEDNFVLQNTSFLKNKFILEATDINQILPNKYWTLKLHKIAYQSKVFNNRTHLFSGSTFENCYSSIKVDIQPNWKLQLQNSILSWCLNILAS